MLVRRISGYLKDQNWFAVWLEVGIVFLGVFIGLQANNWNEERIAKAVANTYYERLSEDFRAEEISRLARIAYFERTKLHGETALRALEQPNAQLGGGFLIDMYQTTQTWYFTINRSTYDELLAGGISKVIPDSTLLTMLANFYIALESGKVMQQEMTPLRDNLRRYMPHTIQKAVRENCGDRIVFLDNYIQNLSLPDECAVEFEPQDVAEALVALQPYVDLEGDLTRHIADLEAKLHSLRAPLEKVRETIEYLEAMIR